MAADSPSNHRSNGSAGPDHEVVITGLGVASPIGIGLDAFWQSLEQQRSGIRPLTAFDTSTCRCKFGGEIREFEPKKYVRPRKSLKVMSRDIQLGFAAADFAVEHSGLQPEDVDPERKGVIYGADMIYCDVEGIVEAFRSCVVDGRFDYSRWGSHALSNMYPLWMLKYLPNMPACHIGIAQDARGPNNSITHGEVSSLLAMAEAASVIRRGQADVVITGGSASQLHPTCYHFRTNYRFTKRNGDPAAACRPFDATRDGMVSGEGAAAYVMESRRHAEARGAKILARLLGFSSAFEPALNGAPLTGSAIANAIRTAMRQAHLDADQIDHVNAHGDGTVDDDRREAQAIREVLGDVAVTAPKSFFGTLGAAGGAVETAASVLAMSKGIVPVTLNYENPDPDCPVNVIHGQPRPVEKSAFLTLSQTLNGQAAAMVIGAPN